MPTFARTRADGLQADDVRRFRQLVVDAHCGAACAAGDVFVLIKAMHFNHSAYSEADRQRLEASVHAILHPAAAIVSSVDGAYQRFRRVSLRAMHCLFPNSGVGRFDAASQRRSVQARVAYWWGALAVALELVETAETRANAACAPRAPPRARERVRERLRERVRERATACCDKEAGAAVRASACCTGTSAC